MVSPRPKVRRFIAVFAATILLSSTSTFRQAGVIAFTAPGLGRRVTELPADGARYRIDAAQSRLTVRAFAGGFLSAFAHDHTIAIREFAGEAQFTYGSVEPASLQLTIKAGSLAVTDKISASQRQEIETKMRDEVLEVSKYPEIVFKSTSVNATKTGEGQYQARISGELILHGVTRPLTINAGLEFGDQTLRAKGAFALKQTSFSIQPVSIAGGTIKVKDELKFTFDVVTHP